MKYPLTLALGFFVALPSIALAAEPAKGTVIMVSSVGLWVMLSSFFMVRKGVAKSPDKESENAPKDPGQSS